MLRNLVEELLMSTTQKQSNMKTVTVEINGQQDQMLQRLVASDPLKRSAEELIREGFLEFAKMKRLAQD
jgi:Arc/MetJ-type ribon-helix-helix transcriptional regulator